MALEALHPFKPNVHNGNPGLSADRRTRQAFEQMSYPPPPQTMVSPDMGLPHPELPGPYSIPSQSESGSVDGNWTLQRSFSTPEGASMAEQAQAGTPGEKKRNKLGYHRTSVACSHCRGRKIRCIPAAGDAQGRCASCIRLKRECSFKPTEQQRGTEARSRSAAQHVHMDQRSSQSSSPTPSGHAPSQPPAQRPFPPLATNTHHMRTPMSAAPIGDGSLAPMPAGQQYDFNQGVPSYVPSNINPYLESAPQNWNNPWHGAPLDSPVSEHPPDTPVSASWASGPASQETVWAGMTMPVRSMSYGGESLGNNAYGSLIPGGRIPSGYANSSMPNSSVEGFQIDAGSTATMPSHNSMQWQQQPHPQISQPGYGNWPHGDLNQIQTDGHRETASGVDG